MIDGVPASYDELFDEYFGYVKGLVAKLGIRENEDVASEILIRFIARDFLEKFDPGVVVSHGGVEKKTNFKAFLRAFVERYARHYRERQGVRDGREPLQCDKPLASGRVWVEVYAKPFVMDPLEALEEQEAVLLMRKKIAKMPIEGKRDHLRLFDMLVPQARMQGRLDRQALASEFGVSSSVISSMIRDMRIVLQ